MDLRPFTRTGLQLAKSLTHSYRFRRFCASFLEVSRSKTTPKGAREVSDRVIAAVGDVFGNANAKRLEPIRFNCGNVIFARRGFIASEIWLK